MVAAQVLEIDYPVYVKSAVKPDSSINKLPEVQRVRELMYWELDNLARSEWVSLGIASSKPARAIACYAFDNKWADLSVQATITAKLWDHT